MPSQSIAVFQWHLITPTSARRAYVEATLLRADDRDRELMLEVNLVRDEIAAAAAAGQVDAERRVGLRLYAGLITSSELSDAQDLRALAHLAPIEGQFLARRLMDRVLVESPGIVQVAAFDDATLTRHVARIKKLNSPASA